MGGGTQTDQERGDHGEPEKTSWGGREGGLDKKAQVIPLTGKGGGRGPGG